MRSRTLTQRGVVGPAVVLVWIIVFALVSGCSTGSGGWGLSGTEAERAIRQRQASPTEIQALVMVFADKYAARSAEVLDRVHDEATTIQVRRYAREAKVAAGWAAVTTATEINPVAAMLDMVTMVRLKRMSFEQHGVAMVPTESAQRLRAMHEQSEREVWELAGRFLTEQQAAQLRDAIDGWYEQNSEIRAAAHLKLTEFAGFRRESVLDASRTPANVLSLLAIDPLARMDPVQRELNESRLLAERMAFFIKRVPPLLFWQVQFTAVDLLGMPEAQRLLAQSQQAGGSIERFVEAWERLPDEAHELVNRWVAEITAAVAAERQRATKDAASILDAQREALFRDAASLEGGARNVLLELNRSLAEAESGAAGISASARETVDAAKSGVKDALDHAFRLALTLLLVALVGVPLALFLYRYACRRFLDGDPRVGPAAAPREPG